jgi:glyoxylase-like metal-dependent hydrolase (beta-lactamase superfamily II)
LASLQRLAEVVGTDSVAAVLPGHGPVLSDPAAAIQGYLDHRRARLAQVVAALDGGARTPSEVVAVVYADVDRALWPAAELSVRAQLDYLDAT